MEECAQNEEKLRRKNFTETTEKQIKATIGLSTTFRVWSPGGAEFNQDRERRNLESCLGFLSIRESGQKSNTHAFGEHLNGSDRQRQSSSF